MQESMYSAMFGAMTQEHRLASIANNLANVNTTGYKKDKMSFNDVFIRFAHDVIREPLMHMKSEPLFPEPDYYAKPRIGKYEIDFTQGSLRHSDNPLDIAIAGEGFFKVQTPAGDMYTRNGNYYRSNAGQMVNANGDVLLGEGGPIALPASGHIAINSIGQILVDGEVLDTIAVVTVNDTRDLEKFGQNYFRGKDGFNLNEQPAAVEDFAIEQGYLETANVEVVTEMVNMIEAQRSFEAYQKTIKQSNETDIKAISQVGSSR